MTGSIIDLILTSGWRGNLPPIQTILSSPAACASENLPVATTLMLRHETSGRVKKVFRSTPHRINAEAVEAAVKFYRAELPRVVAKLGACGSKIAFHTHVQDLQTSIRKPWMMKVNPKPPRHIAAW